MSKERIEVAPEAEVEVLSVKDHTMKDLTSQYPGKMAVANERGTYAGCRLKLFVGTSPKDLEEQVNDFFVKNQGLLVVDVRFPTSEMAAITYTGQVDDEYQRAVTRLHDVVQQQLALEKAKELEEEERLEKQRIEKEKDERRLIGVGRTCEEHHRPVIDENKALKAEVKKLKKGKG